jgi:hypothetical protein
VEGARPAADQEKALITEIDHLVKIGQKGREAVVEDNSIASQARNALGHCDAVIAFIDTAFASQYLVPQSFRIGKLAGMCQICVPRQRDRDCSCRYPFTNGLGRHGQIGGRQKLAASGGQYLHCLRKKLGLILRQQPE